MANNTPGVLRTFIPYLSKYKRAALVAAVALVITAAASLGIGQGLRILIDDGFAASTTEGLIGAIGFLGAIVGVMAVGSFVRFYAVTWLGERIAADLRNDVFSKLLRLDPAYFETQSSGDVMSRLTTDTSLLQSIIGSSLSFALRSSITAAGALVMMLLTNLALSAFILIGVPLVLTPILLLGRRLRKLSRQSQDSVADVGSYAGEAIRQIKTVKAFNREPYELAQFGAEVENAFNIAKKRILNRSSLIFAVMILSFLVLAAMMWFGGQSVIDGTLTPGDLTAFMFYAVVLAMSTAGVSEVIGELQRAAGAAERITELLDTEATIVDGPAMPAAESSDHHLRLINVNFQYPTRDSQALIDVSLTIPRGKTTAIVGASGAGKSTLFELLMRFYELDAGSIELNSTPIQTLPLNTLRSTFAWVPQQPSLFTGSVRRNILYGNPNASEDALRTAAEQANALEFIERLPEGFDSELGEAGVLLSGGQKQRIAIARAILADPEILLLDEATSALDNQSEHKVQQALDRLMQGRTTLVIAHRLTTVENADQIVLMDQGKIIDIGTHKGLLEASEAYRALALKQG
ncbi:MAG: ATP-binding cassette domain-containing protein [Gammaproteobacteria bacterium]|nr:ATP-binding cassette domain-containing protein [Gammaproteobacteria bacterium]